MKAGEPWFLVGRTPWHVADSCEMTRAAKDRWLENETIFLIHLNVDIRLRICITFSFMSVAFRVVAFQKAKGVEFKVQVRLVRTKCDRSSERVSESYEVLVR